MDRVRGQIAEVIGPDRVLLEIARVGNYNSSRYPDVVVVRFTDLAPPYLANVQESERVEALNRTVLGVEAALQISSRDLDGALVGKLTLEGVRFRGKRRCP
jgi:hypothetical protein